MFCCGGLLILPSYLITTINDAGYSGEMFVSIFVIKFIAYAGILIIIMLTPDWILKKYESE